MQPPLAPLAIIGNLAIPELAVVLAVAVMVFGRQLPEVTMRGLAQVMRLRRSVMDMWREAGLQEELRRMQHEVDLAAAEARRPSSPPPAAGRGPTERPRPVIEATSKPVGPGAERSPDPDPDTPPAIEADEGAPDRDEP